MEATEIEHLPEYWDRLNEQDKKAYVFLRKTLASPSCKNRRNRSCQTFKDILDGLKAFIIRGEAADMDRALVCGIYWLKDSIAINVRQLSIILTKSKSSINGSFQQLGYGTVPTGANSSAELIRAFPLFEHNYPELRKWTVRQLMSKTPQPSKLTDLLQQTYRPPQYVTPPPDFTMNLNVGGFTVGIAAPPPPPQSPLVGLGHNELPPLEPAPARLADDELTFAGFWDSYDF